MTHVDAIIGTPAYMAPEQHDGDPVDERADQFSFCVALYEALYGELPFEGTTLPTYLESLRAGALRPARVERRIPEWLRQVITRGLSLEPTDRFDSMNDLLTELGADPERIQYLGRKERVVIGGGIAAFLVTWLVAAGSFGVDDSYGIFYATDLGFLALVLVLGWLGRHEIRRSSFNRSAYIAILSIAVTLLVFVVGSQAMGLAPERAGPFHMLIIGAGALPATMSFGSTVLVASLVYFAGFLLSAFYPDLYRPALGVTHLFGAMCIIAIVKSSRFKESRPGR